MKNISNSVVVGTQTVYSVIHFGEPLARQPPTSFMGGPLDKAGRLCGTRHHRAAPHNRPDPQKM